MLGRKRRIIMRLRKYLNLSDLSLAAAAVVGSYVLANVYIIKRTLPANTCPVQSYDKWLYLAIALAIVSFLTDMFDKRSRV
jgi:phosphatidylglycerophosphate synthase